MIEERLDKEYFERRAEAEIKAAQAASHAAVARAHYELASHYLDLVHNPERQAASEAAARESSGTKGVQGLHIIAASPRA
jgi:hypothetical protein